VLHLLLRLILLQLQRHRQTKARQFDGVETYKDASIGAIVSRNVRTPTYYLHS
jgi:hypothetical protein